MFDLHVDCIVQHELFGYRIDRAHRAGIPGQPLFWHSDLPRMQEAQYRGACFGIHWWPVEDSRSWSSVERQILYLDAVADDEEGVVRARAAEDWECVRRGDALVVAPGVEGAHMLDGDLRRVEELAALDVAYLTLAHFSKNAAATPAIGRGSNEQEGLTSFGRELVAALEGHDLLVDLAHVNTPGVLEACEVADGPVVCTHTGVAGVHESPRNLSDDEVDAIAETGGIVGIIFAPVFLAGRLVADTRVVADHVEYVAQRVGHRHVAIGTDYDGWIPSIPSDQRDCRDARRLPSILRDRGWGEEELDALLWENALEVLAGERNG